MNCPNCAEPLGERGVYCGKCASQARCMKCREILEPGTIACVECGTRIGQSADRANGDQPPTMAAAIPVNRNTLSYQEDRNSRRFEASLTDSAMHGLGDVFGELFAQRGVGRVTPAGGARTLTTDVVIEAAKQLPAAEPLEPEEQAPPPKASATEPTTTDRERLQRIFNVQGESLELRENRLKATSAADYYKRLTYLFIYAQEILLGRSSALKNELVVVLKAAKIHNGNCRAWLAKKIGFTVDDDQRMKLNEGAKEQARKAVEEILDSNVEDEWNPDTRVVKPRKKKA